MIVYLISWPTAIIVHSVILRDSATSTNKNSMCTSVGRNIVICTSALKFLILFRRYFQRAYIYLVWLGFNCQLLLILFLFIDLKRL
jgi:hypothetical protein